jgi:phage-related tail protein
MEDFITLAGKQKGVTDDELRPAMAGLVRATKSVSEAQKAATLAMDVAAAKGMSLETVTKAMEKAYGGNYKALALLSPELKQMIKDGASMEEVMAEMAVTFGGAATDSANTAAGSMKRLGVALGEAKEGVGAALLPILEKALPVLQKFAQWAQENPTLITAVAAAFGVMAASIMLVNAAMALNPVVLITAGVIALGVALVMAYKKFDTFRAVINYVVNSVASNFEFMANAFITMINLVIRGINLIKPGKDIGSLGRISLGRIGDESNGGDTGSIRGFEAFANGGIITQPTLALMGEKGPEMVVPLTGPNAGAGMGGGVTINVNGGDPNAVVAALRTYMRQNGSVPIKISNAF